MIVPPKNSILSKLKKQRMLLLFLLPAVACVFIFNYLPMAGIVMAFQKFSLKTGYLTSPWVGFANFAEFLNNADFWRALRNTVAINLLAIVVGFPAPIVFALLLNELNHIRFKKAVQTITYFPHFISWVVVAGLFYKLLDASGGAVNLLLEAIGLEKVPFMREPGWFWPIIVAVTLWKEIGWNSIIYIAVIAGIDPTLYEAAMIDGANRFQRIRYINIPALVPTIVLLLILTSGSIVSVNYAVFGTMTPNFEALYNFSNPLVISTADVVDVYAYRSGIRNGKFSYAASIGLTVSVISFTMVFLVNAISKKKNSYGLF